MHTDNPDRVRRREPLAAKTPFSHSRLPKRAESGERTHASGAGLEHFQVRPPTGEPAAPRAVAATPVRPGELRP